MPKIDHLLSFRVPLGPTDLKLLKDVRITFSIAAPQHSSTHQTNPSVRRMDGDDFITPGFAVLHPGLRSFALSELWIQSMNWWAKLYVMATSFFDRVIKLVFRLSVIHNSNYSVQRFA